MLPSLWCWAETWFISCVGSAQLKPTGSNHIINYPTYISLYLKYLPKHYNGTQARSNILAYELNLPRPNWCRVLAWAHHLFWATLTWDHLGSYGFLLMYFAGQSSSQVPYTTLRRTHGILNMVGWGILLPIGSSVARFCKHWDPAWFYAHVSIQGLGFGLGIAAVILGFRLENKISANVGTHKALGISILSLGCLQVCFLAFLFQSPVGRTARYTVVIDIYPRVAHGLAHLIASPFGLSFRPMLFSSAHFCRFTEDPQHG